jgi:hypothetical protein
LQAEEATKASNPDANIAMSGPRLQLYIRTIGIVRIPCRRAPEKRRSRVKTAKGRALSRKAIKS